MRCNKPVLLIIPANKNAFIKRKKLVLKYGENAVAKSATPVQIQATGKNIPMAKLFANSHAKRHNPNTVIAKNFFIVGVYTSPKGRKYATIDKKIVIVQ